MLQFPMKPVLLCAAIFFSSWATISLSENGGGGGVPPCLSKLMPCLNFLRSQEKPTATCCIPLKGALDNDIPCLCSMYYNEGLIKSFNVTQKDILGLPPRCGLAAPDLNKCNRSLELSPIPSPPAVPINNPTPTGSPPATPSRSSDIGMSMKNVILFAWLGMYSINSLF